MNGIDRRRYPRRNFTRPVGCLYRGGYSVLEAGEIGEGGMLIYSQEILPKQDRLLVSFILPSGTFISIKAEIVNHTKKLGDGRQAHGISFLNLPFQLKREIRTFVAERSDLEKLS